MKLNVENEYYYEKIYFILGVVCGYECCSAE